MIAYCDTSALLKLFVEELDSERVARWLSEADQVACSCVGLLEAHAAFARRRSEGHLTADDVSSALELFAETWQSVAIVDLDVAAAASLASTHVLRSLDAVHLSAALSLADQLAPLPAVFATFDRRLARVASDAGLTVWPADEEASSQT
jgi:predicted nucleic acid-binding protein